MEARFPVKANLKSLDDDRWLEVRFDFSAEIIEKIKERIPGIDRKWDRDAKVWLIRPMYRANLLDWFRQRGYKVWDEALNDYVGPPRSMKLSESLEHFR